MESVPIGIGVSLGEAVSNCATALLAKIEPQVRKALSALPAEAVMLTYLGPSIVGSATLQLHFQLAFAPCRAPARQLSTPLTYAYAGCSAARC